MVGLLVNPQRELRLVAYVYFSFSYTFTFKSTTGMLESNILPFMINGILNTPPLLLVTLLVEGGSTQMRCRGNRPAILYLLLFFNKIFRHLHCVFQLYLAHNL